MVSLQQQIREAERAGEWDRADYLRGVQSLHAAVAAGDMRVIAQHATDFARGMRQLQEHLDRMQRIAQRARSGH